MIWTKSVCGYFLSCCCVYLGRPGAWWIGVEWCSQVCNKPSISDRSFIMGLWWARRGLPRSITSSGPLIGWPGRKPGPDWLLAGYQCPLSNNDGSPPDSLLSASLLLGSSCLRSPATRLSLRRPRPVQQTLCQKIPRQDKKNWTDFSQY